MKVKSIRIAIELVQQNNGQIEGVPKNPRIIRDKRYKELVQSIRDMPEMLEVRRIIVFPIAGGLYVAIGGNKRLTACAELEYKEVPCFVLPADTTVDVLKEIIIKDNTSFGEYDWEAISTDWAADKLKDWGMELWSEDDILDAETNGNLNRKAQDMKGGVRKSIQIDFNPDDYQVAFDIIQELRKRDVYVGGEVIKHLKSIVDNDKH